MPRANKSPVVGVVSYFQSAPLESAELTLAIVKHVVAARREAASATPPFVPQKKAKSAGPRKERADKGKSRLAKVAGELVEV